MNGFNFMIWSEKSKHTTFSPKCLIWDLNPGPLVHKTNTLTAELIGQNTYGCHPLETNEAYKSKITARSSRGRINNHIHGLPPFQRRGLHGEQRVDISRAKALLQGIKGQPLQWDDVSQWKIILIIIKKKKTKREGKKNTASSD